MDQNIELREFLKERYQKGCIIFVPGSNLPKTNGLFIPTAQRVILMQDDFYKVQTSFGIKHFAFMKLADAAGVQWAYDGINVGRMDSRSNPNYCSFRVVGKIRTSDGLLSEFSSQKHLDLDAKRGAMETKHAGDFDYKLKFGGGKGPNGYDVKKPWPVNKEEYVQKFTERDIGQLKDNMDERCESGAQSRVIKSLLHIPGAFPTNNRLEFHIVKYALDPQNPVVQQAQLASFQSALSNIYGGPPQQITQAPYIKHEPPVIKHVVDNDRIIDIVDKGPDKLDSALFDFENSDRNDQILIIEGFVKNHNYVKHADYVSNNGPLSEWGNDELKEYFKFLIGEIKRK